MVSENLEKIIEKYGIDSLKDYLQKIKDILHTNKLSLAVMGGFKAGKSSFLNEIIGKNILPVGILPTTNIITKISKGNTFNISVVTEKKTFEIQPEALPQYLTENLNPQNEKQVKSVEIEIPNIDTGLEYIDTPGTGSFFRDNTETTLNWIPQSAFVIYAINPQQPFSEQDIENLRNIFSYTDKVSLLLTKVDLLSESEKYEMTQYINQISEQEFNRRFQVFYFSTKSDKAKYLSAIKSDLLKPLKDKKQENINEIITYKTEKLKDNLKQYLLLLLETKRQEQSTVEVLKEEIVSEQVFLKQIHQELGFIAKEYTAHTRESLKKILLESNLDNLKADLQHAFSLDYYQRKGNLYKRTRFFENWLQKELSSSLKQIFVEKQQEITQLTVPVQEHFERQVILFRDRMNARIEPILHRTIPEFLWQIPQPEIKEPDVAVNWTFDSNIDLLWWLFPMPLWKKFFFRFFRKRIPAEIEKNLYRLVSQITQMVNESINQMQEATRDYLFGEYFQIVKLLEEHEIPEKEILDDIRLLQN